LKDSHQSATINLIRALVFRKPPYKGDFMASATNLSVDRALKALGQSIELARRRRGLSQADLASRMGVSVSTVRRLEDGHHGTALTYLASALQVFGELEKLRLLLDTPTDSIGLTLMDAELPTRIYSKRRKSPKAF
jgi:DNA-binding XRE family transcriptional regulator